MKTNREKNTEHDKKEILRVRPKQEGRYEFEPLAAVIRQWVTANEQT
jgi:hypothetical protein